MNDWAGGSGALLSRGLSLLGFAAIAVSVVLQFARDDLAAWALACCLAAGVAWVLLVVFRFRGNIISLLLIAVMAGGGAISGAATGGTAVVIAAIAVVLLTRDLRRPLWWGACLGVATILVELVGGALKPVTPLGLVTMMAGILVAFLVGESRRQFVLADIRARDLVEEQARTDVLASRQQLAHDIHDVLAHSLGGLVIQLDAVDALLDAGDTAAASAKVRDARLLAAEGLGEARRAVAALGATSAATEVQGATIASDALALIAVHRSLGGSARLIETGHRVDVSGPLAVALRRAVQEGLTNARKHSPGTSVSVSLNWDANGVSVEISNPLGDVLSSTGGGHGLLGMRERFAALPGGAVTSRVDGGRFVVTARANTAHTDAGFVTP